ncbi:hypothetical protein ACFQ60_00525 [Streptomyces zhihengii]
MDARSFTADVTYEASAQDRVLLATVHRGTMIDTTGGRHDVHEPGETFLLAPPGVPTTGRAHRARCTLTLFDASLLTEVTAHSAQPVPGRGPVRFTGRRPSTPAPTSAWAPPSRSCATTSSPTPTPPTARSAQPPPATSPPSPSPPSPTPPRTARPPRPGTPLRPPRPCAAP